MAASPPAKPRLFVDADVLFAGAAAPSEHGASLVILRMAEITLIDAVASHQVLVEVERNLGAKLPAAVPIFQDLSRRCLRVVPDPEPAELVPLRGLADPKDLPPLAVALRERCAWLMTFNVRHYRPGHRSIMVLRPGELLARIRHHLVYLT